MVLKKWFIIIFAPPGHGKSIEQAKLAYKLIREYYKLEKKYPKLPHRYLLTNQPLSQKIKFKFLKRWRKENLFVEAFNNGHLRFWNQPEELRYCPIMNCWKDKLPHPIHDCDLFCDEGATLFPATGKGTTDDMPIWMKTLISQHRHRSIRIVLLTQDFMGINITARRCCWEALVMEKRFGSRDPSPSLPPVKWIWGIYTTRKIDPDLARRDAAEIKLIIKADSKKGSEDERKEAMRLIGMARPHWISRFKCSLYDTLGDVRELQIKREIEHIEVPCSHPDCNYIHKTHRLK